MTVWALGLACARIVPDRELLAADLLVRRCGDFGSAAPHLRRVLAARPTSLQEDSARALLAAAGAIGREVRGFGVDGESVLAVRWEPEWPASQRAVRPLTALARRYPAALRVIALTRSSAETPFDPDDVEARTPSDRDLAELALGDGPGATVVVDDALLWTGPLSVLSPELLDVLLAGPWAQARCRRSLAGAL